MLYEEMGYFPRTDWLNYGAHFAFEGGVVAWTDSAWRMVKRDGSVVEEELPPPEGYAPIYAQLVLAMRGERPVRQAWEFAEDAVISQACYASARLGHEIDLTGPEWAVRPARAAAAQGTRTLSLDHHAEKLIPEPAIYARDGDASSMGSLRERRAHSTLLADEDRKEAMQNQGR